MASLQCKDNHGTTRRVTTQRVQDNGLKLGPNKAKMNKTQPQTINGTTTPAGTDSAKETQERSPIQDPFQRAPRILRSPTQVPRTQSIGRFRSPPPVMQADRDTEKEVDAFSKLGGKIAELQEMMGGGRRSIHQPMRDLVTLISSLYQQASRDKSSILANNTNTNDRCTQTLPQEQITITSKRMREENDSLRRTPPKKTKSIRPERRIKEAENYVNEGPTKKVGTASGNGTSCFTGGLDVPKNNGQKSGDWMTKTKKRRKAPPPDVVIIKPTEKLSFADILKKVRSAPELKSVGNDVHFVKKTQKGEILLELKRSTEATADLHRDRIRSVLTEDVEVSTRTQEVIFELRYLDEITTKEEILNAWKEQIGEIPLSAIRTIRSVPGGSRTAIIAIPTKLAYKVEEVSKLRVGWTVCRLLRKVTPKRCYKCLDFGHISRNCRSESDWSKSCFKCGGHDHRAKTCQCEPLCLLCRGKPGTDARHITGGTRCPSYLSARRKLINKGL